MNALEFSARFIYFAKSSEISGPFNLRKYRMLEKPLLSLDDISKKETVVFKASGCMGTVFGQIASTYRIARKQGDMMLVLQSDDDADKFSDTRGKDFLLSVSPVRQLVRGITKDCKYPITQRRWLFSHKFLIITGPGVNAQNSDQVTFLQTDEAHLFDAGVLAGFDGRIQSRGWLGSALHTTTAPDAGHDIDTRYQAGDQNEWHLRCLKCNELIWMLWTERAREHYNGERVFQWRDEQSDNATLDSLRAICPHCQTEFQDISANRNAMNEAADYLAMNPHCEPSRASYRWNRFAASWLTWKDALSRYLMAIKAAKLGDLKPHEEFVKKVLCETYTASLPDYGQSIGLNDYMLGDAWTPEGETVTILTADYQAGKQSEGLHLWALVTKWDRRGNSRRIAWRKLDTWEQLRAMQTEFEIHNGNVFVDCGFDNHTVFKQCGRYQWYSVRGSDDQQFHRITIDKGKATEKTVLVPMPYSMTERCNGNVGEKQPKKLRANIKGNLPEGWCLGRVMSNPMLYGYLYALQSGNANRYFGIARDMPDTYTSGFPAFMPIIETDKKTNTTKRVIWKMIKKIAHPWDCEVMALMGAMIAGYYPIANSTQPETKT